MRVNSILIIRLILLLLFVGFVAGFAVSQYEYVRSLVTVLCLSCIGIG
jgi:uncharacterized membrane protein